METAAGSIRGHRFRLLRLGASCLLLLSACLLWSGAPAEAQEVIRRQTLFERLFGGPPEREALPPAREQQRGGQRQRRARTPSVAAPPPAPEPETVEKLENALDILVVGDFLAGGLAEGLEAAYAESPGVRVVDRTNGSSGFVRDDFYDWNAEIGPILEEVEPDVVVVMIGSNDRQALVVDGRSERPQTEAWRQEYMRRVESFAASIEAAGLPLIWTGLPPFKASSMSSDMLAFNDIHSRVAEEVGGTFVDIWDGFVDENGAFVFTGPDMNGQPVRLRASDGINLTRPAKRKVAFYVEQPLNKLLGTAASPDIGQQELENLPLLGLPGAPGDLQRTGPIPLAAPELDGGGELLGAAPPSSATGDRPIPAAQPGRADDFSLRRRRGADEPGTGEGATTGVTP